MWKKCPHFLMYGKRSDDDCSICRRPRGKPRIFADLHKLYIDIKKKNHDNDTVSVLSMGMTNDYEVAIEEGATMVRVGTGIFGARNYVV